MATHLEFVIDLKGRHLKCEGSFYPACAGSFYRADGDPGDPPEPANIELTECVDGDGNEYEPTDGEFRSIVDRAETVYYEAQRFDMREEPEEPFL
jgi:hypothetical protein